ncbi:unnamed protein product [Schistosoma turkestanicum]|nr:unnamed protein product [Schistosoma turkestanicum]
MYNFSEISPLLLKIRSCILLPKCGGRYLPPGALYRPHTERFDENCERRPLPHPETPRFQEIPPTDPKSKAKIAGKRPFHMICEPNQVYWWCSCGHSKRQPFCDGHHIRILGANPAFKINKRQFKPIRLVYEKPSEVWFCTCKQTSEPPYCDGTHNCKEVQSQIRN